MDGGIVMAADRCRRTSGIVERTLAGRATDADRVHAAGCAACSRALTRAPSFDRMLGGALASLAAEPMPSRLLEAPSPAGTVVRPRGGAWQAARLLAVGFAAVLVVLVGAVLLRLPVTGPAAPVSPIRSEAAMVAAMADLGFSCRSTVLGPEASPPLKGQLCTPAVGRSGIELAAAIERDPTGAVHGILGKGRSAAGTGAAGRTRVEDAIAGIVHAAFPSATDADPAEAWVRSVFPTGDKPVLETRATVGGLELRFEWSPTTGYLVHVDVPSA
jgi:hypothetical protein